MVTKYSDSQSRDKDGKFAGGAGVAAYNLDGPVDRVKAALEQQRIAGIAQAAQSAADKVKADAVARRRASDTAAAARDATAAPVKTSLLSFLRRK